MHLHHLQNHNYSNKVVGSMIHKIILIFCILFVIIILAYCGYSIYWSSYEFPNIVEFDLNLNYRIANGSFDDIVLVNGKSYLASKKNRTITVIDNRDMKYLHEIQIKEKINSVHSVVWKDKICYMINEDTIKIIDVNTDQIVSEYYNNGGLYDCDVGIGRDALYVYNDSLLICGYASITTVDLKTGEKIARREVGNLRQIIYDQDNLYVVLGGLNVHSLDPKTLEQHWEYVESDDLHQGPKIIIIDKKLFFQFGHDIKIFDTQSGNLTEQLTRNIYGIESDKEKLYFIGNNYVSLVDTISLKDIWRIDGHDGMYYSVEIQNGYVYIENIKEKELALYDSTTGGFIWKTKWLGESIGYPNMNDDYVVIESHYGKSIYILAKETGKTLWRFSSYPSMISFLFQRPNWYIEQDKLFIIIGGRIYVYDLSSITTNNGLNML